MAVKDGCKEKPLYLQSFHFIALISVWKMTEKFRNLIVVCFKSVLVFSLKFGRALYWP